MSRYRLRAKVRTNASYQALTRFLDDNGFRHEVVMPGNKGHPALRITGAGRSIDYTIACTPKGRENVQARLAELRRELRAAGMLPAD